jgi:hypothetical protein
MALSTLRRIGVANKNPIVYNSYCHDNKKIKINKKGGFMKSQKFSKKLSLNKKTIAHLSDNEKQAIQGGQSKIPCPTDLCPTSPQRCPTVSYDICCV